MPRVLTRWLGRASPGADRRAYASACYLGLHPIFEALLVSRHFWFSSVPLVADKGGSQASQFDSSDRRVVYAADLRDWSGCPQFSK